MLNADCFFIMNLIIMIVKIKEVVAFMKEKGVTIEELNAYYGLASKANFTMVIDDFF